MKHRKGKSRLTRCQAMGLVILHSELDAKIVLAQRMYRDKGERRYFACGTHFHLSAEDNLPPEGMSDTQGVLPSTTPM